MGNEGADEESALATKTTLQPEEPVSAPDDGAASQNLIERIGGEDYVRFLAEASEILAGSLDYETELERVARLSSPRWPTGASSICSPRMGACTGLPSSTAIPAKRR